jgi:DNA replication protein DnaC
MRREKPMDVNQIQASTSKAAKMDDLIRLRDKHAKRDLLSAAIKVFEPVEAKRDLLSAVDSAEIRRASAAPTKESVIPERAKLLREACRVGDIPWDKTFERLANDCVRSLASQLGGRYTPDRAALSQYEVYGGKKQQAALDAIYRFIADIHLALAHCRGLVLYGSVGTGKDHLIAAVLYEVARAGIPTSWTSGEDLFLAIRDTMDTSETEERILTRYLRPIVLGISDPTSPRGDLGDWDARVLARIIDRRYRAFRPTWITMNATSRDDARNRLTSLIWDRMQDQAELIPCFWPSFRERSKP